MVVRLFPLAHMLGKIEDDLLQRLTELEIPASKIRNIAKHIDIRKVTNVTRKMQCFPPFKPPPHV